MIAAFRYWIIGFANILCGLPILLYDSPRPSDELGSPDASEASAELVAAAEGSGKVSRAESFAET